MSRLRHLMTRGPGGPYDPAIWRSPIRGAWLASFLSVGLLVLFGIDLITGYLSHAAYQPDLGQSFSGGGLDRHLYGWDWPTSPAWLYAFTQGLHITAGIAVLPILAAKLWAVIPKFYKWPPVTCIADALERLLLGLLVGSGILLIFTGLWDISYWYTFPFSFIIVHYYAAWIFLGTVLGHVLIKLPVMREAFRTRGALKPLREDLAQTRPEPPSETTSAPSNPAEPTVSRRGFIGVVGAGSLGLVLLTVGESLGGPLRSIALLSPRGRQPGSGGPNDFQVNKTADGRGIKAKDTGAAWRLLLKGPGTLMMLSRDELLAMPQHTYTLPIACVEGWSTTQDWTGVRLRDLAAMAGVKSPDRADVESLQQGGSFRQAALNPGQVNDDRALLALKVNGADLSMDHGFPARMIVPALPGVHNTKWVKQIQFSGGAKA